MAGSTHPAELPEAVIYESRLQRMSPFELAIPIGAVGQERKFDFATMLTVKRPLFSKTRPIPA